MSTQTSPWDSVFQPFENGDGEQVPLLLSANHLKTWNRCKKRFQLHVLDSLRWPTNPGNFEFGQTIHALMDHHARGLPVEPLLRHTPPEIARSYKLLAEHPLAQAPVVASEWGFTVPIESNIWLTGRMDRLSTSGNGTTIVDWKTGTAIPQNPNDDWQTRLYLYAAVEATPSQLGVSHPPDQWAMAYIGVSRKGVVNTVTIPYSQAMHEETKTRLQVTLSEIRQSVTYPLPAQCPDRYCGYRNVCGITNSSSVN